jgi:hypothetical protein
MQIKIGLCLIGAAALIYGCVPKTQPAYYLSPLDINSSYYHTIPLKIDSVRSAIYTRFSFFAGGSNYQLNDVLSGFQGGIHRSHNFGVFQAYYGGGLTEGSYHASDYYRILYPGNINNGYQNDTTFHIKPAHYSFFSYGLNGGFNYVIPFDRKNGEWRFGFQGSVQHESGTYLSFRKSLVDSSIDLLATDNWIKQIGFASEWVRRRRKTEVGYKIAFGWSFPGKHHYVGDSSSGRPVYFINTLHVTVGKITGFFQFNVGVQTATVQTGLSYRLLKSKKKYRKE